jgi:hypothetical protein
MPGAAPHNGARATSEKFFVRKRRKIAGILCVFQDFATQSWQKIPLSAAVAIVRWCPHA